MEQKEYFINKTIPETVGEKLGEIINDGEKLLFVIVGDMTTGAKYGETALAVTEERFIAVDPTLPEGSMTGKISEIESAFVKRMYGNAQLRIKLRDGSTIKPLRFTYSVATLCDMAAAFLTNVAAGNDLEEEYEVVAGTYEKLLCVCPKCGRKLLRPGAECINCASKGKIVKKMMKYVAPEGKNLVFCLILSGISTALALLPPYITQMLVDDILPNKNGKKLLIVVAALAASYLMGVTVNIIKSYRLRVSGGKMVEALRNDVYRHAQYLPMKFYDKTSTGAVINRISGDTGTINNFVLRVTQEVVVQFFLLIGIIIIMFVMNWKLTLLSLVPVPIVVVGAKWFGKKIAPFYRRIWRRWSAVTSVLTDSLPGIRVVKAFAGEKRAVDKFESYNREWLKVDIQSAKITTAFPNIISFVVTCGSLLIWAVGGSWVIADTGISAGTGFTAGLLVSFISYTSMFYGPVNFFAYFNDSYQNALASIERVFDILDAEPEVTVEKHDVLPEIQGKIEFKNVNFSFDRTKKVLSDVNITIEPGDIVGIVGTTGSGKTTMINLLMRFYDNYEGEILLDGHNIKDLDMEFYRSKIGYVQQESMLFRDTVFNNIAYSKPDATVEEVIHAADVANAHEFIARQPDAYDTMLGERGIGLSGGEKQRISIARAVLKNPSLMIFDEATASVDSETENLIQEAIERLISGRTTIMIAHRLSTLRKANRIIVVDQGKIIENGSHDELMALKGKYYKLVEIQSMSDKIRATKEAENFE